MKTFLDRPARDPTSQVLRDLLEGAPEKDITLDWIIGRLSERSFGILLLIVQGIELSGDEWIRLALIIFAGMLFFGLFLSMSIFVSSLTYRSSNSFLILLVVWITGAIEVFELKSY